VLDPRVWFSGHLSLLADLASMRMVDRDGAIQASIERAV
jgi:hypothetical protein